MVPQADETSRPRWRRPARDVCGSGKRCPKKKTRAWRSATIPRRTNSTPPRRAWRFDGPRTAPYQSRRTFDTALQIGLDYLPVYRVRVGGIAGPCLRTISRFQLWRPAGGGDAQRSARKHEFFRRSGAGVYCHRARPKWKSWFNSFSVAIQPSRRALPPDANLFEQLFGAASPNSGCRYGPIAAGARR